MLDEPAPVSKMMKLPPASSCYAGPLVVKDRPSNCQIDSQQNKRDFVGCPVKYGANPQACVCFRAAIKADCSLPTHTCGTIRWPGGAKVAVSFVLNFEEGAESCTLLGDAQSETLLCDLVGVPANEKARNIAVESLYEYGSRSGYWRIRNMFREFKFPLTVFACGRALEENPLVARDMAAQPDWEVSSHGYRWLDYSTWKTAEQIEAERIHIQRAVESQKLHCGSRPLGFYQGKPSSSTLKLVAEEGGFLYSNDFYADDLPCWSNQHFCHTDFHGRTYPLLLIPYTLTVNDMKFTSVQGFVTASQFFEFLRDTYESLEAEQAPRLMSVGLHCRIIGHPGRIAGLKRFMSYLQYKQVYIGTRQDIARHWFLLTYGEKAELVWHRAWPRAAVLDPQKPDSKYSMTNGDYGLRS